MTEALLFDSAQVKEYARTDLNFFSALAAGDSLSLQFPDFYQWLWQQWLGVLAKDGRSFDRYAIGLPRGHGKTMLVKLLLAYIIGYTDRRYILVIGASSKKAEAIIADVCDMLDNRNFQDVYGNWRYDIEIDRQELKKFTFNGRPVILEAAGYGTAIRGSNQKNERPEVILFDDAQSKECAESVTEALTFQQWFLGTAMKAKSPTRCLFLYLGNMYKDLQIPNRPGVYACMLRNLQLNPGWVSFVVGALLDDGTALWEELHPREQLLDELRLDTSLGQADIFFAEVLNMPDALSNALVDTSKFQIRARNIGEQHDGCYIVIDPATNKATPDQQVILYNEIYDNVPVAVEMFAGKMSSPETVEYGLKLAMAKGASLIVVEANAYQYALCEWFEFFREKYNIHGLTIMPAYTRGVSKNSRISTFFRDLMAGRYQLSADTAPHFVSQAAAFNPTKTNNLDDILDAGEMSLQAAVKFRHMIAIPGNAQVVPQWNEYELPTQASRPTPCDF